MESPSVRGLGVERVPDADHDLVARDDRLEQAGGGAGRLLGDRERRRDYDDARVKRRPRGDVIQLEGMGARGGRERGPESGPERLAADEAPAPPRAQAP